MMDEFHMRSYIDRLEKDRRKLLQKNVDLECEVVQLKATVKNLTATNEKLTKLFKTPPTKYSKQVDEINTKPRYDPKEDEKTIDEIAEVYENIKSGVGFLFLILGVVCFLAIVISWMVERVDVIHPIIYGVIIMSIIVQILITLSPSKEYFKKILRLNKSYKNKK